jgi:hypothetical protein
MSFKITINSPYASNFFKKLSRANFETFFLEFFKKI